MPGESDVAGRQFREVDAPREVHVHDVRGGVSPKTHAVNDLADASGQAPHNLAATVGHGASRSGTPRTISSPIENTP